MVAFGPGGTERSSSDPPKKNSLRNEMQGSNAGSWGCATGHKALLMSPNKQSDAETSERISIFEHCSVFRDLLKKARASRTDGERRSRQ